MRRLSSMTFLLLLVTIASVNVATGQDVRWQPTSITEGHIGTLFVSSEGIVYAATDSSLLYTNNPISEWVAAGPGRVHELTERRDGVLFSAGALGVHRSNDRGHTWERALAQRSRDECGDILHFYFIASDPDGSVLTSAEEEVGPHCKTVNFFHLLRFDAWEWETYPGGGRTAAFASDGSLVSGGGEVLGVVGTSSDFGRRGINVTWFDEPIVAIIVDGQGHIFAGTGLNRFGCCEGIGIFRSTDAGATWDQVNAGLSDLSINDLAVSADGILFAATPRGGVFRSVDNGDTWHAANEGLPTLNVTALAISDDGFVYVGTDRGLYRSATAIGVSNEPVKELPQRIALGQNYPNPFNPSTTIPFELVEPSHVSLRVYDALGRHVRTLVDAFYPSGRFEASFGAEGLPSGVYLYRMEAGGIIRTAHMTLAK